MEEWRPVPSFEGLYEVSNHGQVRSLDRRVFSGENRSRVVPGQLMKLQTLNTGHLYAQLSKNGEQFKAQVHHLVLVAFDCPRPDGLNGLHRDDDPLNNHILNLYWGTQSQNMYDKVRNGNHHYANKTTCKEGHELVDSPWEPRRYCPICRRKVNREYRLRQKAKRAVTS
jgi:hypothetical protein